MNPLKPGDLVFLTKAFDAYFREKHPESKVVLTNRIGRIEDIIDWDTAKGKMIRKAREDSGKWKDLPIEECRHLVTVYYPDLIGRKGQGMVVERSSPMFEKHPKTGEPFFMKLPDWMYKDLISKCHTFQVVNREVSEPTGG